MIQFTLSFSCINDYFGDPKFLLEIDNPPLRTRPYISGAGVQVILLCVAVQNPIYSLEALQFAGGSPV